jgi:hypothetical protein
MYQWRGGATPDDPALFWKAGRIRHVRRVYAERQRKLQSAGKRKAVRTRDRKERRIVTPLNHGMSKALVTLAKRLRAGIRFEDLSGIRKSSK